jgi:AmiR/NasT family two-component response regulator
VVANVGPSDPQLAAALERILELETDLQAARRSVTDLTTALESNRDIGAAIGIVMVTRAVESEAAFDLLREASQSRHTKLRDVAREVVALRELAAAPAAPAPPS